MAKRGRPPLQGMQAGIQFIEILETFHAYTHERSRGMKYDQAVQKSIDQFKKLDPHWCTSRTKVKRLINQAISKEHDAQFRVTKYCDLTTRAEVTAVGFEPLHIYTSLHTINSKKKITAKTH